MSMYVSVVIPVYNNAKRLECALSSVCNQTYSSDDYEVLVIDNGSDDGSPQVAEKYNKVEMIYELDNLSSPYSARNRGIEEASGDVIALLDANCVPVSDWIRKGVECLRETGNEMVGGKVEFEFEGESPSIGELYDSLTNVQMEESIRKNTAKTANLFIRRDVFDSVGMFPEGIRSGGDVRWTSHAVENGFILSFCPEAKVYKSARHLPALIRKQWRVGKGKAAILRRESDSIALLKPLVSSVIPIGFFNIKEKAEKRGHLQGYTVCVKLFFVRLLIGFVMNMGTVYAGLGSE